MPVAVIDIPSGLTSSAKAQLHKEVAESVHHAHQMSDTRVYLREWTAKQTSLDGVVGAPFRPMCNFIVPPILTAEGRRTLVSRVSSAITSPKLARWLKRATEILRLSPMGRSRLLTNQAAGEKRTRNG